MIYITGDIHQNFDTWKFDGVDFKSEDFLIICGDFGGVWDGSNEGKYWLKWLKNKNFTTLFIDGIAYPIEHVGLNDDITFETLMRAIEESK